MQRLIYASLFALLLSTVVAAQEAGLPPLGSDAIQNVGKVIAKYDKFTDKSKVELMLRVKGEYLDGLNLILVSIFEGRTPPARPNIHLGVVSISPQEKFATANKKIFLLIDGQRQIYEPTRFPRYVERLGINIELLLIAEEFTKEDMLKMAAAKSVEGRAGSYAEFVVTPEQQQTIREFVRQLQR